MRKTGDDPNKKGHGPEGKTGSFLPLRASGVDFLKHLANGGSVRRGLIGMVKASVRPDCIAFAPTNDCNHWVDLPATSVFDVEVLAERSCVDHKHPVVRLTLDEEQDNPHIVALRQALAAAQGSGRKGARARNFLANAQPGDCFGHWDENGEWVCDDEGEGPGGDPTWDWELRDGSSVLQSGWASTSTVALHECGQAKKKIGRGRCSISKA